MKQTQNGSQSPRLESAIKMLGAITFWTGFPVLLMIAVLIAQSLLSNPAPVIIVATVVIFCIYLAVRAGQLEQIDSKEDFLRNHLMCLITGAVVLRLTYNASAHMNPWGTIGWAILVGVMILILVLVLLHKKGGHSTWTDTLKAMDTWRPISAFLLLSLGIQQIYLHWAASWVWVPIGMTWLLIFTTFSPDCSWQDGSNDKKIPNTSITLVLIAIGLVSLIWQFWTPIIGALGNASMATISFIDNFVDVVIVDFWGYWLIALALIGISLVINRQRQIQNKKIADKLAEERRVQQQKEREENETKRKERDQEQKDKDLLELTTLTTEIASNETRKWKDIRRWKTLVDNLGLPKNCAVDPYKIMTTPLLSLFSHSKEKNQIAYNGGLVKDVWELLDQTIQNCFDDEILIVIKKNLKDLEKFKGAIGYDDMYYNLKQKGNVRKFYEAKEEQVA